MGKKKNKGISAAEMQRRQKQSISATPPQKRISKASDFIDNFCADIINLANQANGMRALLKGRIEMSEKLVEANPLKFNVLRIDSLKEVQKSIEPLHEAVKKLMTFVGALEDLPTFAEKMSFATEHVSDVIDATYLFNECATRLQDVDARFNQHLQSLVNPAKKVGAEGSAFEGHIGSAEFNVRYHSTVCDKPGTVIPLWMQFDGSNKDAIHNIQIKFNDTPFLYMEEPYTEDVKHIEFSGTIDQLNSFLDRGDYLFKISDKPTSFMIEVEGLPAVPVEVLPAMDEKRNEDIAVEVSKDEAEALIPSSEQSKVEEDIEFLPSNPDAKVKSEVNMRVENDETVPGLKAFIQK